MTLIEYAAYCGSIQVFQYLKIKGANLSSLLWKCVIHNENPELIHILEENKIEGPDNNFFNCYKESIKCYNKDISLYIKENMLNQNSLQNKIDVIMTGLNSYNFESFESEFENAYQIVYDFLNNNDKEKEVERLKILTYLAKNDYMIFVQFMMKIPGFKDSVNINEITELNRWYVVVLI